ncbi:hypothetical protein GGR53DRAFT_528032 [Hypoxylon sp. FL1150]|nr:hypothetical protein GGR53DRAFT_528032 [Hypoxylon sp. FL1150]
MTVPTLSELIRAFPIGSRLDEFRNFFLQTYKYKVEGTFEGTSEELFDLLEVRLATEHSTVTLLSCNLLSILSESTVVELLASPSGRPSLQADVLAMLYEAFANNIESARFMPLLGAALRTQSDVNIWCKVYDIAAAYHSA